MNICIFTRTMPAHRKNKAMFHSDVLGRGLAERGHRVSIITTGREEGIEVEKISDKLSIFYLRDTHPEVYSKKFWKKSAEKFDKLNEKDKFDIICSESEGAFGWLKYSKNKNIPLVHIKHNTLLKVKKRIKFTINSHYVTELYAYFKQAIFFRKITSKLLEKADAIICVSKSLGEMVIQDCPLSKKKIRVIHNGVNMDMFNIIDRKRIKILKDNLHVSNEHIILFVGRIYFLKGLDYLIKAMPYIRNFKLIIIGKAVGQNDEKYRNQLKNIAKELGVRDNIIFIDGVSHDELPLYYSLSDLVVLPSISESFAVVILEAFASMKPVIATHVGGIPEMVKDGENGFLIPPRNPKILAEKIQTLLNNKDLRQLFAKNGYNIVTENFTLDRMIDEHEKVFRTIEVYRRDSCGG